MVTAGTHYKVEREGLRKVVGMYTHYIQNIGAKGNASYQQLIATLPQ